MGGSSCTGVASVKEQEALKRTKQWNLKIVSGTEHLGC